MTRPLYQHIAATIDALHRCEERNNPTMAAMHRDSLNHMADNLLPSGSGIDCGTTIDWQKSTSERLVLTLSYHHMNNGGCYDGWTEHTIIVTPSLVFGLQLRITGRNRNDIKDYLHDTLQQVLTTPYEHTYDRETETHSFKAVA